MNPAPADNAPVPHHIAGRRLAHGPVLALHNPANGQILRWVHVAEGPQIVQALASARSAQPAWAARAPDARAQVLARLQRRAEDDRELLQSLLVQELGLTRPEAQAELQAGLAQLAAASAAPTWLEGPHQAHAGAGLEQWTQAQPLGVVVGVLPFCGPWSLLMGLAPWALAAGNAFIAKPSPHTPSLAVWLAEALLACGLAPGLFQVLQGDGATAQGLLHHPDVAGLSVVGRSSTARELHAGAAALAKPVQALGGAKNHLVVLPDADLAHAADAIVQAAFGAAGQRCAAASALVLVGRAAEGLMPLLSERLRRLRVGNPARADSEMGPLISGEARARVAALIDSGAMDGAQLLVDGRGLQVAGHLGGHYLGPTLFDQVQPWMQVYQQEVFGPLLVGLRVRSLDDALALIDGHPCARSASLFTRDAAAARRFTQAVQVGQVGVNVASPAPRAGTGAGGWKASQLGGPPLGGPGQLRFYTRPQAVQQCWA